MIARPSGELTSFRQTPALAAETNLPVFCVFFPFIPGFQTRCRQNKFFCSFFLFLFPTLKTQSAEKDDTASQSHLNLRKTIKINTWLQDTYTLGYIKYFSMDKNTAA